jgi:hypothetical protein
MQHGENWFWTAYGDCWVSVNRVLVRVVTVISEAKANMICRIGIEGPTSLLRRWSVMSNAMKIFWNRS